MNCNIFVLATAGLLNLTACSVVNKSEYQPPSQLDAFASNERLVDRSFDETWSALISSVGKSFFAIQEFEKASGLLTLTFTTSPFSVAIDGGHFSWNYSNASQAAGQRFWFGHGDRVVKHHFDGNYADFIQNYLNGTFDGYINLVVTEESENQTRITVNTRFVVAGTVDGGEGQLRRMLWSWNSGQRAQLPWTNEDGEQMQMILQSNHYAESKILDAIDQILGAQ